MTTRESRQRAWLNLIDQRCDAFEQAWRRDEQPELEAALADVPEEVRGILLRELLVIELDHRRDDQAQRVSPEALIEVHRKISGEIRTALQHLAPADEDQTVMEDKDSPSRDHTPTIAHTPGRRDSRGLHIRCPHCHSAVELLADTPFEDVTCRSCGSTFNLVKREETTRMAESLQQVGRFELISRLGIGGFGTVWKARDTELDRAVAVKIPRKGQLSDLEVEQFFREARAAAQLKHPNIVPVHEVGREGDTIFVVSDLVRGISLADWLTGQQPTSRDVAELCVKIADALHHAHQQGVVHRDLKPSNVMMDEDGQPHVMDFGLAKREVGEITITADGQVLGTPAYMSPEQARGEGHWTDRRTDIYSLGVVIFQLLTGELPFRGNAQMQMHQVLTADPPSPRTLNSHIPRDMATICLKCLEKDPNKRYHTTQALSDELQRFLRGEPTKARPISSVSKAWRWAKRNPSLATAIGLTIFLAIGGPFAAIKLERQRLKLVAMIQRYDEDVKEGAAEIDRLQSELNVWAGRADPWDFWPPSPIEIPQREIMRSFLEQQSANVATSMQKGALNDHELACGHLGLAIMQDASGDTSEALMHYREGARILEKTPLHDKTVQIRAALADCYLQMARLCKSREESEAGRLLQQANAIYEQLVDTDQENAAKIRARWLDSQLRLILLLGSGSADAHLHELARLKMEMEQCWPSEPLAVYDLACSLGNRQPLLLNVGH